MAQVLIVDDETVSRVLLRHLLQGAGHEVIEAGDGGEGAELFAAHGADLVISDQDMPVLTGLELRRELGADLTAPFVLLTGYATQDEFTDTDLTGVDAYLTKPISSTSIIELLESLAISA